MTGTDWALATITEMYLAASSIIVVCNRNYQASSTFPSSPFRRVLRSASRQRIRLSPATTNRSTCTVSASCTASPKWLGPDRVSTCSSSPAEPPPPDTSLLPPA